MSTILKYAIVGVVACLIGVETGRWIGRAAGGQGETQATRQPADASNAAIQEFAIEGMSCQGCVQAVTEALKRVPGVQTAKVSLAEKRAIVVGDASQATAEKLIAAISAEGYKASPLAPPAKPAQQSSDYTRAVARPYKEVLAAVEQAAKAEGFRVSHVHDLAASLAKEGIQREPYATVEICNAKLASQVLQAEPRLGSLMPCRIAVYQQGDKTVVSMVLPSGLMTMFPVKPEVHEAAAKVDQAMKTIVAAATR